MKYLFVLALLSVTIFSCSKKTAVQNNANTSSAAELIESRNYIFKAITAIPARGRTIQLNSDYTLRVSTDTVRADLPFFGRAYTAPIGQSSGGIEFTSTDFVYNQNIRKNGAYEIEIIPRDHNDVQRVFLTVSKSGYGSLYVNSQNRQGITFNGYIEQKTK
jgi:hypothetical protein